MTRAINFVATLAALGIFGYFVYKVIVPKLGDLQLPTFQSLQPPPQRQQQQQPVAPPPAAAPPPAPPPAADKPATKQQEPTKDKIPLPTAILPDPEKPKIEKQPATKSTKTEEQKPKTQPQKPPAASQPPPGAIIGKGLTPEALAMKSTGQKVAMNAGGDPAGTGRRYNCNHKFQNYVMIGLYKIGVDQELIEMKTDGPNHSGCSEIPKCFWAEPRFDMNGKSSLSMEMPHTPRKDYTISCPSCKSIPGSYAGKWIGYAVAAYGPQGGRIIEQWVDPTGTGNSWQLTLREKIDARFREAVNRPLPFEGKGLEAEIRMINEKGGTDFRNAFVYEIVPPAAAAASNLAITRKLMIDEPYLFNRYHYGRRL